MAKKSLPENVVFVEQKEGTEKTLPFDHAEKLVQLQHRLRRHDWKIKDGQKLEVSHGRIIPTRNTGATQEEAPEDK